MKFEEHLYDPAIYNLFLERSVQFLHSVVIIVKLFIRRTAKWYPESKITLQVLQAQI